MSNDVVFRATGLASSIFTALLPIAVVLVLLNESWTASILVDRFIPSGFQQEIPGLQDYPREQQVRWIFAHVPASTLRAFAERRFPAVVELHARTLGSTVSELPWESVRLVLLDNLTQADLVYLLDRYVLRPQVVASFSGLQALFQQSRIEEALTAIRQIEEIKGRRVRAETQFWLSHFWSREGASFSENENVGILLLLPWLLVIFLGFVLALPASLSLWLYLNEAKPNHPVRKLIVKLLVLARYPTTLIFGLGAILALATFLRPLMVAVSESGSGALLWYTFLGLVYALTLIPVFVLENGFEETSQPGLLLAGIALGLPSSYVMHFLVLPARFGEYTRRCLRSAGRSLIETGLFVVLLDFIRGWLYPDLWALFPAEVYHLVDVGLRQLRPLAASAALTFLFAVFALRAILMLLLGNEKSDH